MRMSKVLLATLAMGVVTGPASAQQASPPPATFAVYFRCDYAKEARSDTLFRQVNVPALEKQVKAGHFTRYAWSSHQIGGQWRRLMSFSATNVEHLVTGRTALLDDVEKSNPKGSAEFDAICGSHDDYIWEQTAAGIPDPAAAARNAGGGGRGAVEGDGVHDMPQTGRDSSGARSGPACARPSPARAVAAQCVP